MSSTNKTSLGLNMWEASDKPVRQDFINDNVIIDEKISELNSNLDNVNSKLDYVNSNLGAKALTLTDITYSSGGTIRYAIKNGVCYVDLQEMNFTTIGNLQVLANGLPKPAVSVHVLLPNGAGSDMAGLAFIDKDSSVLRVNINKVLSNIWISFSYPVTS